MPLRATLFDMDGLLFDSEVFWHQAEVEVLGALGVPLGDHDPRVTKGVAVDEVVDYWFSRFPWAGPPRDEVVAILLERVAELVETRGRLLAGVERALELTAARGPLALASSTPLATVERLLGHFGLREHFAVVRSAQFEPFGKPHPAVFLSAAAALGVPGTECLVVEDSAAGVIAGKAGRMSVIAVPAVEDRELPAFAVADLVLDSLADLDEAWLEELFSPRG
jgi:HAD superfamily hydrolase (TIGR01509 family)